MSEYLQHLPSVANLVIAVVAMHYLIALTRLRLTVQVPKSERNKRADDDQPGGFFSALAWGAANRLPELIIAGIAIPDIPVLVKLITG